MSYTKIIFIYYKFACFFTAREGQMNIVSSKMKTFDYEAPKVEIIYIEAQHCFATSSEYVSSPSGLSDLNAVDADWD